MAPITLLHTILQNKDDTKLGVFIMVQEDSREIAVKSHRHVSENYFYTKVYREKKMLRQVPV